MHCFELKVKTVRINENRLFKFFSSKRIYFILKVFDFILNVGPFNKFVTNRIFKLKENAFILNNTTLR